MSRLKSIFAVLVLTAIAGIVPQAQAQTLKVLLVGSSAMWQTLALGAYNDGTSIVSGSSFHWTSASNPTVHDSRGTGADDKGGMWIVWDGSAATATNVWAYVKVDSVVGVRCYFASPQCNVIGADSIFTSPGGNAISSNLWGADTPLPANVQALFNISGGHTTKITAAATDIRPEDAWFATCRVNSSLGASAQGGGASDGLDGLGYNANNAAGVCPAANSGNAKGIGTPIQSGYTGDGSAPAAPANVLAFSMTGKDPITNGTISAYTVTSVGASPIVFLIERDKGQLTNLRNASEQELQQVFSGTNCNANAFAGLPSGAINVYLREPLSGTMNTTEATVFRYPTIYPSPVRGLSQETGVGLTNPLQNTNCAGGGGQRSRAIGTGEEVKSVRFSGSVASGGTDGIGYAFFSYGNVSSIANNANYGYITLNGVDPIFSSYGTGTTIDPGQPASAGTLPLNTPCGLSPNSFPCPEWKIWGDETKTTNHYSFPNLRNGTYRAWSLLRTIATATNNTNVVALINASQKFVVSSVPDYVPAKSVANTGLVGIPTSFAELGLKLLRSHYQQEDGAGTKLVACAVSGCTNVPEKGGDMGGEVIPTTIGVTTEKEPQKVQGSDANGSLGPAKRPVL